MGLKERFNKLKEAVSTGPIDLTLIQQGTADPLHAGQPAVVYVLVKGENDGTVEQIDLFLQRSQGMEAFPLGTVPDVPGKHAIEVQIPAGLEPSVAEHIDWTVRAKANRNTGLNAEAFLPIDIVARPEDLPWPDGPRSGQDGDASTVEVLLEADTVDQGSNLTGIARISAAKELKGTDVRVAIGYTVRRLDQKDKFEEVAFVIARQGLSLSGGQHEDVPFSIELPAGTPATYRFGPSSIVWRVEAKVGKTTGWALFGALDPKADGGIRARQNTSIASLLASGTPR